MYNPTEQAFVPVPEPETKESKKLTHFSVDEVVYVKGMSFRVHSIEPRLIRLVPIDHA